MKTWMMFALLWLGAIAAAAAAPRFALACMLLATVSVVSLEAWVITDFKRMLDASHLRENELRDMLRNSYPRRGAP